MQPDTILESSLLPEEPDIPLSVRFLEPAAHPTNKRIRSKEEVKLLFYLRFFDLGFIRNSIQATVI